MNSTLCPTCGAARFHRSRCRSRLERLVRAIGGRFGRCHECNARVFKLGRYMTNAASLDRCARRAWMAVILVIATLLVLAMIMWYGQFSAALSSEAL